MFCIQTRQANISTLLNRMTSEIDQKPRYQPHIDYIQPESSQSKLRITHRISPSLCRAWILSVCVCVSVCIVCVSFPMHSPLPIRTHCVVVRARSFTSSATVRYEGTSARLIWYRIGFPLEGPHYSSASRPANELDRWLCHQNPWLPTWLCRKQYNRMEPGNRYRRRGRRV